MTEQLPLPIAQTRKDLALEAVLRYPLWFREDFSVWLDANFHVWTRFEQEANRVWEMGRRHYSAHTVIEYLRHYTLVADRDAEFKLNERWTSSIARLYAVLHPDRSGFFEFRQRADSVVETPLRPKAASTIGGGEVR